MRNGETCHPATSSCHPEFEGQRISMFMMMFFLCYFLCTFSRADELSFEKRMDIVNKGVSHLIQNQSMAGDWDENYGTAMTAFAGLALLSAGHVPGEGPYRANVERIGLHFLRNQKENGMISNEDRCMYGQGFATLFLSQVYGMTRVDDRIQSTLEKAVQAIVQSQDKKTGGWNYNYVPGGNGGDEGSVTIVQVQALRAARDAGIHVPHETIQRSMDYIRGSQNANGSVGYRLGGGGATLALTAQGLASLYSAGEYSMDASQEKGFQYLDQNLKNLFNEGHVYYGLFYAAQAYNQRAGDEARHYFSLIEEYLIKEMKHDPSGDIYWEDSNYGSIYATSIAVMIFAMPLELLPIFQK